MVEQIQWQDFDKVDMRVGRVIKVEPFSEARKPSYLLAVDFGEQIGVRRSAAALASDYSINELQGRLVVAVTNFPAKQIAHHMSEVLVLAAAAADGTLQLLQPDGETELGARIR